MPVNCIYDKEIYLGFMYLKELEGRVMDRILKERQAHGAFTSLEDFLDRVLISISDNSVFVHINAFRFYRINKRELL